MTVVTPAPFQSGYRLVSGDDLNAAFAQPVNSVEDGITATPSGVQATARPLTAAINRVSTVASGNDAVGLPLAKQGLIVIVVNGAVANSMQVFGAGTDTINDVATATGVAQAAGKSAEYICTTSAPAGKWFRNLSA